VIPAVSGTHSGLAGVCEATEVESTTQSPPTHKRRGRRRVHAEHWTKVTVVLMDREIVFLDRLVADIRAANGAAISRAHLIRALIDALAESDIDVTACRSGRDLTELFGQRFQPPSTTQNYPVPKGPSQSL
jgi:hypothetical protein